MRVGVTSSEWNVIPCDVIRMECTDTEDTESEWKLFRRVIFVRYKDSTFQMLSTLIDSGTDIATAFPNLTYR